MNTVSLRARSPDNAFIWRPKKYMDKSLLQLGLGPRTSYPRDSNLVHLFENVAKEHSTQIALSASEGTMPYRKLNEKANQI